MADFEAGVSVTGELAQAVRAALTRLAAVDPISPTDLHSEALALAVKAARCGGNADAARTALRNAAMAKGWTDEAATGVIAAGWRDGTTRESGHFQSLDLSPIKSARINAPAFPLDVLGDRWARWVRDEAEKAGAPVAYVACALLTVGAALIGNARRAQARQGWDEPSIIWMAIVGDPSSGKSPALRPVLELVKPINREMVERFGTVTAEHEAKVAKAKAVREDWDRRARDAGKKGQPAPPFPTDAVAPEPPTCQAFRVDDATIEKLAAIAKVSLKGMLMGRDELAGLLANFDRYNNRTRHSFLEAYNGDEHRIDRQKLATPLLIPHWSISVLGGIQPDRFTALLAKDGDNDGLAARFLHCWPDPVPPKLPIPPKPWAVDWASIAARRLFGLALAKVEGSDELRPTLIPLSKSAIACHHEWQLKHHEDRAEGLLASAWGKMPGQALRLALAIELLQWAATDPQPVEPKEIGIASLEGAIALIESFFKPMARRVYRDAGQPKDLSAAATLARHIVGNRIEARFNAVNLRQGKGCPAMLRDARAMDHACGVLAEVGWLRPAGQRDGTTKGRTSKDYEVNPTLWAALEADTASNAN